MKRSDFVMKPLRLSVVRRKKTQSSFFLTSSMRTPKFIRE